MINLHEHEHDIASALSDRVRARVPAAAARCRIDPVTNTTRLEVRIVIGGAFDLADEAVARYGQDAVEDAVDRMVRKFEDEGRQQFAAAFADDTADLRREFVRSQERIAAAQEALSEYADAPNPGAREVLLARLSEALR